ncbi:MAG: N-acetylmuramoyl-L-alanine amidase [Flavobacteriaceae bacterium]
MNKVYSFFFVFLAFSSYSQQGNCPQPSYCDRYCWDSSGTHPADSTPTYTDPTHIIVHHSETNYPSNQDYSDVIRSIWNYHKITNGWDDIGYNWLIDPNGVLYEGRGDGVKGAHFSGMNSNTMGVCLIGNFQTATPTNNAINKLQDLIAWEATDKNINVLTSSYLSNTGLYLHHIAGHRDGGTGTVCPGNNLYNLLPSIRTNVSNYPCYDGSSSLSNDECNNAIVLQSYQDCNSTNGTVDGATSDSSWNDATCDDYSGNSLAADVFYKFTATNSSHTITVHPTGNLDPVLSLYQGSNCYNLNEIGGGCVDSGGGYGYDEILNATNLNIGQTYWIRIYDYGSQPPSNGSFEICITHSTSSGLPDIIVENESINPTSIQAGNTISVSCRIRNNSSYDATNSGRVGYYLSSDATYDANDILLGSSFFGTLNANQYSDESDSFTIPTGTSSGNYYILFYSDYQEYIDENIEYNNIEPVTFIITNTVNLTYVPDNNFEQALIDLGYDDVLDGYVLTSNISSLTYLDVSNKNITDLTGIKDFTSLTTLWCVNNQLISLNISLNTTLTYLYCYLNQLTSLDVSQNTILINLFCAVNRLTNLEVSQNARLSNLSCYSNQLTSLDVSQNTSLTFLQCNNNQLTSLNLKNGNNTLITTFDAFNNPDLSCIDVDNPTDADTGLGNYANWNKDVTASYSADCQSSLIVNDELLDKSVRIYPNPMTDILSIKSNYVPIKKVEIYSVLGKKLKEINTDFSKINISNLSVGIYVVKIYSEKGITSRKLIKN